MLTFIIDSLSALICECDFVYTTPNITVGLSGALGKQTHLLLPFGGQDGGGVLQAVRVICLMEYAFIARTPILVIGKIQ